jgi:hypothetical protein
VRKQEVDEVVLHMLVGQMQRTVVFLHGLILLEKGPSAELEGIQMQTIDEAALEAFAYSRSLILARPFPGDRASDVVPEKRLLDA